MVPEAAPRQSAGSPNPRGATGPPDRLEILPPGTPKRLLITAHGIRAHGDWQARLQNLFPKRTEGTIYEFRHLNFGFYSFLQYIFPWSRSAKVRWCTGELEGLIEDQAWERIDIVAH